VTQLASMGGDTAADNGAGIPGGATIPPRPYALADVDGPLSRPELELIDAWWRAANYLAVGQIYLMDNPLLREELIPEHVKPRLLGHFGTVPGLNLLYVHANRLIKARDLNAVFVAGPGHAGRGRTRAPGWRAPTPRYTAMCRRTPRGCASCSASSPFPAACPATARRRPPARSTRAASWDTR
jgi:xylulose-5-phosphate/fructose-6-phosphate phosphoketolase